jgi:hypothetical protein
LESGQRLGSTGFIPTEGIAAAVSGRAVLCEDERETQRNNQAWLEHAQHDAGRLEGAAMCNARQTAA